MELFVQHFYRKKLELIQSFYTQLPGSGWLIRSFYTQLLRIWLVPWLVLKWNGTNEYWDKNLKNISFSLIYNLYLYFWQQFRTLRKC